MMMNPSHMTSCSIIWTCGIKYHSEVCTSRVKSGIFGQTAKFGQRPCLFHISNIGMKIKLTKQTVKILMRRLLIDETAHKEPSHLDLHCLQMRVQIYLVSEFT